MSVLFNSFHAASQNEAIRNLTDQLIFADLRSGKTSDRLRNLAANVGELNLMLLVTLRVLIDKGVVAYEDIAKYFAELDALDGKADGKVTVEQVRAALRLQPPAPPAGDAKVVDREAALRRMVRKTPG